MAEPAPQTAAPLSRRWRLLDDPDPALAEAIVKKLHVAPLIARCIARRKIESAEQAEIYWRPALTQMLDPRLLHHAERAAERIVHALTENEHVAIYADYDVDGVTACSILYHTFKAIAPEAKITRYVPH